MIVTNREDWPRDSERCAIRARTRWMAPARPAGYNDRINKLQAEMSRLRSNAPPAFLRRSAWVQAL